MAHVMSALLTCYMAWRFPVSCWPVKLAVTVVSTVSVPRTLNGRHAVCLCVFHQLLPRLCHNPHIFAVKDVPQPHVDSELGLLTICNSSRQVDMQSMTGMTDNPQHDARKQACTIAQQNMG